MSTITLPNIRVSSDLTIRLKLKDGGVAIDWSTLQNIRVSLYADDQRSMASRCSVSIDEEDSTILVCQYAANKMQYLGVNRVIVQCKYMGEVKTYDKPAFNFVRWTSDQEGEQITIDDPDVDVEISVEDVSSSILQEAVDAAFEAADRANDAAEAAEHMVDIHTGPEGKSAYEVAVEEGYTGTEEEWLASLKGPVGETPDISIGTVTTVEPGTPAAASMSGTPEAPVLNLSIPKGLVGATPNFTVGTVTTGEPGSSVIVTITGTPEAPVLNLTIPQGMQGNTGSSVDYPYELVNNLTTNDATKGLSAAQGYVLDGKVSQLEAEVDTLVANMKVLYGALGAGAFWGNKPVIDWGGEDVPVIRNLTHCTCDNVDDSVRIGDSYYAEITPDSGYILGSVLCSMGSTSVSVVNGVIDISEVTGPITITASGINLDSVAFDGKTYKQIFETNNALGISPGFESGSYSPLTVNAGSPTITTEDADSGTYSLKASGTSSAQLKTGNKSGAAFIACRVKVTSYVQGICGCQFDQNAGVSSITDGWVTKYANRTATSQLVCYVGSFNSANLTGYVDTPVVILKSSFSTVPTFDEFKALYDQYVAIKKAV